MAELLGGSTIAGYPVLHSGLKEAYLAGKLTMNGELSINVNGFGGIIINQTKASEDPTIDLTSLGGSWSLRNDESASNLFELRWNNTWKMKLATDGDLTAAGTVYANKGLVLGATFTDVDGSMYFKTGTGFRVKDGGTWGTILDTSNYTTTLDGRYLKKAGDTMTGDLNVNGNINFNNGLLMSATDPSNPTTNIDHIWHDDGTNAWHFVSDGTAKMQGNSKLMAGSVETNNGGVVIDKNGGLGLNLVQKDAASGLYNYIGFSDAAGAWQTYIGYSSAKNGHFYINSKTGNIALSPHTGFSIDATNTPITNLSGMTFNGGAAINIVGRTAIQFTSNGTSTNGYGMRLGAGGLTVVGAGESVDAAYNGFIADDSVNRNPDTEELILASDNAIRLYTNLNSGWSPTTTYKSEWIFHDYGYLILPGGRGNGNPTSTVAGGRVLDYGLGYNAYVDNTGAGSANNRFWLDAPSQGEMVLGPRGASYKLDQMRIRADHIWLETNSDASGAGRAAVTIGPGYDNGSYVKLDANEVGAYTDGAGATLHINNEGGDVVINNAVPGTDGTQPNQKGRIVDGYRRIGGQSWNSYTSISTSGWYTIAKCTSRGAARFIIMDTQSGRHQYVDFLAAAAYNRDAGVNLKLFANCNYAGGTETIGGVRVLCAGTYDVMYLQVYLAQGALVWGIMKDNFWYPGWEEVDFTLQAILGTNGASGTAYRDVKMEMQGVYENRPQNIFSGTTAPPSQGSFPGDVYIQY